MNGPDHYKEAERLTSLGHDLFDQEHYRRGGFIIARAQVHATLALAAATAVDRFTLPHADGASATFIPSERNWDEALK